LENLLGQKPFKGSFAHRNWQLTKGKTPCHNQKKIKTPENSADGDAGKFH